MDNKITRQAVKAKIRTREKQDANKTKESPIGWAGTFKRLPKRE